MKDLDEAFVELRRILQPMPVGTSDRPRTMLRIDLAIERMRAWHNEPSVSLARRARRGGTKAMLEQSEAEEDYTVSRRTEYDAAALNRLLTSVAAICARYTIPIDTQGLPKGPPGCRSCARTRLLGDVTLPGYWNPIATRYAGRRLCNWCGEQYTATGKLPPLEAVDIYHRQSPQAAGRWLAKHQPQRARRRR